MKLLPRSFVLILSVSALILSVSVLPAESPSADPTKNKPVSSPQSQQPAPGTRVLTKKNQSSGHNKQTQTESDQRGTEQSPIIIKIAPSPKTEEEAAEAKREKEQKAAAEYRAEVTTAFIAGATVVQAVALIWTICVMSKTAKRQLRAYVSVWKAMIEGEYVLVTVKNTGQTPASSIRHWIQMEGADCPPTRPLLRRGAEQRQLGTISPGGKVTIRAEIMLLQNPPSDNRHAFYVFGSISYLDVFKKRRTTNFRYMKRGESWISARDGHMEICDDGNAFT